MYRTRARKKKFRGLNLETGDTLEPSNLDTQTEDEMLERPQKGDHFQVEDGVSTLDRQGTPTCQEPLPSYSNPGMVNSAVSREREIN
jgi:hypothetical protein